MVPTTFTLRAGRAWLQNPAYREAVRREPTSRKGASPLLVETLEILDTVEVCVDGVNVVADLRESSLFRVMADTARAAESLARGADRALVTFGSPLAELVLYRADRRVLVTLLIQGPPAELRLEDLEVDRDAFFTAIRRFIETFLDDLTLVAPRVAWGPYGASLMARAKRLRGWSRRSPRGRPPQSARTGPATTRGCAPAGEPSCLFRLLGDTGRLVEWGGAGEGDLYSLLVKGDIQLACPAGRTLAVWHGPPFVAFRSILIELTETLSALEAGESRASVHLGSARILFDLATGTIEGPEGKGKASPLKMVSAISEAALELCSLFVSRAPTQRGNCYVSDLAEDARELHSRCRDLVEGDRVGPVPRAIASVKGAPRRTVSRRPLTPFSLRRVAMRAGWTFDSGNILPGGFGFLGSHLFVAGEDGAFALDPETGRPSWSREEVSGAWLGPRRDDPVLLSTTLGLDLVTPSGATAWSSPPLERTARQMDRYLRGAGNLLVCADGRSVVALREADGAVEWRFVAPGAGRCRLGGGQGGVLVASDRGFLYALDADSGRPRWRARTRLCPLALPIPIEGDVHLLGMGDGGPALFWAEATTGRRSEVQSLPLDQAGPPIQVGARTAIPGAVGDDSAVLIVSPDRGCRRVLLEGFHGVPGVLPVRNRIYVSDRTGNLAALGMRGRRLWETKLEWTDEVPMERPVLSAARGLLLLGFDGLYVVDPEKGTLLGSYVPKSMLGVVEMLATERLNVYLTDPDGAVEACTMGTYLSLVQQ